MTRCMIYIDPKEVKSSVDLVEAARQLHAGEEVELVGVLPAPAGDPLPRVFDQLIRIEQPQLKLYDQTAVSNLIVQLHRIHSFVSILIPATPIGRMIAPRVAMLLRTGLVADITEIRRVEGVTEVIRPAYSGSLMACIRYVGDGPMMMSVRPNIFHDTLKLEKPMVEEVFVPDRLPGGNISRICVKSKPKTYDIRASNVLVSGGGGAMRAIHKIEQLAYELNGQASASRKLVDAGIVPRSIQVGQSGKTVSPDLYIALGINGAVQHIEGLKTGQTHHFG